MSTDSREAILAAAKALAAAHGYGGLNFRDLAQSVGIKSASLYYHFPSKAALGAAVAGRYWEDSAADLEAMWAKTSSDPVRCLRWYPETFRWALEKGNRMCLCSFMAAESDDLPEAVKKEVQTFANVHVAWLRKVLTAAKVVGPKASERRARAIFAAVSGAQLAARSRAEVTLYDEIIESYRAAGLLPG